MDDTRFSVSVHIVTSLAFNEGKLVTSPALAESIKTHPIVVRRLAARLVERGLVQSFRGKAGGLLLAKRPHEITLRDVYEASTDGPLVAVAGKAAQKQCPVSCAMGKIMDDVVGGMERASLEYLQQIRLSDLVAKIAKA